MDCRTLGQMGGAEGMVYPRGVKGTCLRIWETMDTQPCVEYASTDYIEFLLAPHLPPATIGLENSNNMVIIISSDDEEEV